MELTTIIGMSAGFIAIVISIVIGGGELGGFLHIPSVFIVFGGTIAATVVAYPARMLKSMMTVFKKAFNKNDIDLNKDIDMIINIANIARREGLLALEDTMEEMNNPFLQKGIMLIVDGADTELIKSVMQTEIYFLQQRHEQGQAVINSMSSYAPAFGMVGTLIGLINMLANLDSPDALGPGMSTALITTLYGVFLANLVFGPIGKKLKAQSDAESLQKELIMEGLLSIQDGENPRVIKDKLLSFMARCDIAQTEEEKPKEAEEIADE